MLKQRVRYLLLHFTLTCACVSSFFQVALAQRGQSLPRPDASRPSANAGFTGFFDANVADPESLVLDLPWLNVDYGLTQNVTIGANGIALLPLLSSVPSFLGKIRYRFVNNAIISSAFTVYGGYLDLQESSTTHAVGALTSNTSLHINEKFQLNFFGLGVSAKQVQGGITNPLSLTLSATAGIGGVGFQVFPQERLAIQLMGFALFYNNVGLESPAGSAGSTFNLGAYKYAGRVALDIRLNEQWLLSGYTILYSQNSEPAVFFLPTAMYRW